MKIITPERLRLDAVGSLGLDPTHYTIDSVEAIAAALRRAAGFLCPCSPGTLIRAVKDPIYSLVDSPQNTDEAIETTLDALISYGDLNEQQVTDDKDPNRRRLIYTNPPAFVLRKSGVAIILGVSPDNAPTLPDHVFKQIAYKKHRRTIAPRNEMDLSAYLSQSGFLQLDEMAWTKTPPAMLASDHLKRMEARLANTSYSGEISGLSILDPTRSTSFYKGRWTTPTNQTGKYVARRQQAYGADLWCFVDLQAGRPTKMLDFPLPNSHWRGYDDAWRLQAAIDAARANPQRFRILDKTSDTKIIVFASPLPTWCVRRLDTVAEPVASDQGLVAYEIRTLEIQQETDFLKDLLWLMPADSN